MHCFLFQLLSPEIAGKVLGMKSFTMNRNDVVRIVPYDIYHEETILEKDSSLNDSIVESAAGECSVVPLAHSGSGDCVDTLNTENLDDFTPGLRSSSTPTSQSMYFFSYSLLFELCCFCTIQPFLSFLST